MSVAIVGVLHVGTPFAGFASEAMLPVTGPSNIFLGVVLHEFVSCNFATRPHLSRYGSFGPFVAQGGFNYISTCNSPYQYAKCGMTQCHNGVGVRAGHGT